MADHTAAASSLPPQDKFLTLLQALLAIPATEVKSALNQAGQLVAEAFDADKVDVLLHDAATETLVAVGVSETPMAAHERASGLDRLPLANGGRVVDVFQTGQPYLHGHVDQDAAVLPGFRVELGIRSMVAVPIEVNGTRRGCLSLASARAGVFRDEQLPTFQAVAHWVGLVLHQAELVERVAAETAERTRQRAADELIAVLAHDFQNHLTPLYSGIQLLLRGANREGRTTEARTARLVEESAKRLRGLVEDLLDSSRLERGLFALALQEVDLAELARETAGVLASADAPIRVWAAQPVPLVVDPARIREALENLLANAQKHTPQGVAVLLEVTTRREADGEWAVLHVRDEGPGVPPDVMPRLFTRFGAGPGSSGLGLGLYLAHGIARAHGGTLNVNTALGQGASFYLALPRR